MTEAICDTKSESQTNRNSVTECSENNVQEDTTFLPSIHPAKIDDGFCNNIKTNKRLRHKYLHTACTCLSLIAMGWRLSMTGPTLPDLRLIVNENLARFSWIISALAFGYLTVYLYLPLLIENWCGLAGSLVMGTIYDKFDKRMTFMALTLCLSVCTAVTPWCSTFAAMVIIHVLTGVCCGGIDTVTAADIVLVWRHNSAPFLQAVNLAFSIGAMISPLTTEPFLAIRLPKHSNDTAIDPSSSDEMSCIDMLVHHENNTQYNFSHSAECLQAYGPTRVHWAYALSAAVSILAFMSFAAAYCFLGNVYHDHSQTHSECNTSDKTNLNYPLSRAWRIVFVVIMAITLSTYVIMERTWYSYLVTFLIEKLSWSKSKGSTATTVFWMGLAIGRLVAIVIVKVLKVIVVFTICVGLLLAGGVSILLAVRLNMHSLVWVSCVLYGLGMSAIFANVISWISAKVCPLTGMVSSAVYTITMTGVIVFPLITGNIMDKVSYDWFIYIEIILTCFAGTLVAVAESVYHIIT